MSLEPCPPLPDGVEAIDGLVSARVTDRFEGLDVTLSTRALACGEPAVQHGWCGDDERGLTVGFAAEEATVGVHPLGHPIYVELETPGRSAVGGGGDLREATVELFEITDTCVTGRIVGLVEKDGPFDGGFRAPRCTP